MATYGKSAVHQPGAADSRPSASPCKFGNECRNKDNGKCRYTHPSDKLVEAPPQLSTPVAGVLIDDTPHTSPVAAKPPPTAAGPPAKPPAAPVDEGQYEYEGILMPCEMRLVDSVDNLCRRICPCKPKASMENPDCTGGSPKPTKSKYLWWEGIRDDVPERYQRWESIRERNVILSLAMRICRHGRKQPTLVERLHLFLLYASAWYFTFGLVTAWEGRGNICRKAWVDTCVPTNIGGGCSGSQCASVVMLALTPRGFNDYTSISESTRVEMEMSKARCVEEGVVDNICELPMCQESYRRGRGSTTCGDVGDGVTGFCTCDPRDKSFVVEFLFYTVLMKVLYLPFWYTFVLDLQAVSNCFHRVVLFLAVFLYVVLFFCGGVMIYTSLYTWRGWGVVTGMWFASFVVLCLFEVVKSFSLGFVFGSYVIEPTCCKFVSRIWKFMLA